MTPSRLSSLDPVRTPLPSTRLYPPAFLRGCTIVYSQCWPEDMSVASSIHAGPWWRHRGMSPYPYPWHWLTTSGIFFKGVLLLNLYLLIPLLTSCVNGYDASLVNGGSCNCIGSL